MDAHLTAEISVVLPAYNAAAHLHEAIESIVQQTFVRWELIVINDGSTDDTARIANHWAERDNRIQCIHLEKNAGLVNALNQGIAASKAPLIARMDADDIAINERLQQQFDYMQQHTDVAICGGAIRWMHNQRVIAAPEAHDQIVMRSFSESPFAHPTVMMRKAVLEKHQLKYEADTFPAEDFDLWSRILRIGQGHNLPQVLLHYRVHDAQISSHGNTRQLEAALRVLRSNVEFALQRRLSHNESALCADLFRSVKRTYSATELTMAGKLLNELSIAIPRQMNVNAIIVQQACKKWWWNMTACVSFVSTQQIIREWRRTKPVWQKMGVRYYLQNMKRAVKQ